MLPAVSRGRNRRMRNSTMSRRALLRAAGAATIVAACAPVTTQPGATQTGTTGTTKPAGATGTLTFLWGGDTDKLDPPAMTTQEGFIATTALYEGLVRYKPNSTDVEPALAERMPDISSDGLAYTFHLRSGIKFHDGSPLTAEAVAFSFDRSINKDNPLFKEAQAAGGFPFIDDYIGNVVGQGEGRYGRSRAARPQREHGRVQPEEGAVPEQAAAPGAELRDQQAGARGQALQRRGRPCGRGAPGDFLGLR